MFMIELGSQASKAIDAAKKAFKANPSLASAVESVLASTEKWSPKVGAYEILTPSLRKKLADAFAHLAMNMIRAERGQEPL